MASSSSITRYLSIAFWVFVTLTLAVYLAIVMWSAPTISGHAGGLIIFDLHPTGYDFETAQPFLDALSVEGQQFYLNVQHRLDLIYPPLLAITLVWAIGPLPKATPVWSFGLMLMAPKLVAALVRRGVNGFQSY